MRLIDADALKEAVNNKKVVGRFNTIQLIDNAPTIDNAYQEGHIDGMLQAEKIYARPQGEWIFVSRHCYKCPFCNELSKGENFCPNCGADMRGEKNNE